MRHLLSSQRGLSLIESLIAVATLGFVIAGVSSVYVHMRDQILMNEALREAEDLRVNVQSLLNQPAYCDTALQPPPGQSWTWNGTAGRSIGQIQIAPAGTTVQPVVINGGPYGRVLRAQNLYVREPLAYEGNPSSSTVLIQGVTYTTVAAKVVMLTQPLNALNPSVISRTADVILRLDGSGKIVGCANSSSQSGNPLAGQCDSTNSSGMNCVSNDYCQALYYVAGFDNQGAPICRCVTSCYTGPQGEQGSGPGISPATSSTAPGLYNGQNIFQLYNLTPKDWAHAPVAPAAPVNGGRQSPPKEGPSAR